ncbi:MAG: hypothetical protein JW863_01355 [Chitinispirillaceae bacterium]|nr:hypothetical protein [Chitinispirillaceae bacterium]
MSIQDYSFNREVRESMEMNPPEKNKQTINARFQELTRENQHESGSVVFAVTSGLLASLTSAVIWAVITLVADYQIGWMAIGVGFFVGFTVRYFGRGKTPLYSFIGSFFSLFGCVTGNLLCIVGFIAKEQGTGYLQFFYQMPFTSLLSIFPSTIEPMDFLFYLLAAYEGFRFSLFNDDASTRPETDDSSGRNLSRTIGALRAQILVIWSVVIVVFAVSTRHFAQGMMTYTYESGAVMSKGIMKDGRLHGLWTYYYESGGVSSKQYYRKGYLDSVATWWDETGKMIKRGEYSRGLTDGKWEYFHLNDENSKAGEGFFSNPIMPMAGKHSKEMSVTDGKPGNGGAGSWMEEKRMFFTGRTVV